MPALSCQHEVVLILSVSVVVARRKKKNLKIFIYSSSYFCTPNLRHILNQRIVNELSLIPRWGTGLMT